MLAMPTKSESASWGLVGVGYVGYPKQTANIANTMRPCCAQRFAGGWRLLAVLAI
jgi:hypothetical protein